MAQNQNTQTGALTPEQANMLIKIGAMSYSASGYMPTDAGWTLTPEQIKSIVNKISRSFLSDISSVTIESNPKTGELYTYVWLNKDSKHLRDTTTMGDQCAIRKPITRFSKELKEFMDKFCDNNKKKPIGEDTNFHVTGFEVRLERFFMIEFDSNGDKFGKEFGIQNKVSTKIKIVPMFARSRDAAFGKLLSIKVTKFVNSGKFNQCEPKAKRSYNA